MSVLIKPGKEKQLKKKHPWIFSGAVEAKPEGCSGEILPVFSSGMEKVGCAFCNDRAPTIFGRMISWGEEEPLERLKKSLANAILLRKSVRDTNAIRLVHADADSLPGLIVDAYDGHLVVQISTLGMEKMKGELVGWLRELVNPKSIYEKSVSPSLKAEGMQSIEQQLFGTTPHSIMIEEEGRKMAVHPKEGQKTGYFIDQKELRTFVQRLSRGKRVLNCFSYTGGFSVAALKGGAIDALSVDASQWAIDQAEKNVQLNGFTHRVLRKDIFDFLSGEELPYEMVILDPPAFAKSRKDLAKGYKAYKTLNTLALSKMIPGSFLITCSCSHFMETPLFAKMLLEAALEAKREIRIVKKLEASLDHPLSLYHPESHYLKSFCLYVS